MDDTWKSVTANLQIDCCDGQAQSDIRELADDEDEDDSDYHGGNVLWALFAAAAGTPAAGRQCRRRGRRLAVAAGPSTAARDALPASFDITQWLRQTAVEYGQYEQRPDRTKHEVTGCLVDDEVYPVTRQPRLKQRTMLITRRLYAYLQFLRHIRKCYENYNLHLARV